MSLSSWLNQHGMCYHLRTYSAFAAVMLLLREITIQFRTTTQPNTFDLTSTVLMHLLLENKLFATSSKCIFIGVCVMTYLIIDRKGLYITFAIFTITSNNSEMNHKK